MQNYNDPAVQEEVHRQIKEVKKATVAFPCEVEAWRVNRVESHDKFGDTVELDRLLGSTTVHTAEEMREFGNRWKKHAANITMYNVAIRVIDADQKAKMVVYPRKAFNLDDVTKTTAERDREKVQRTLLQQKQETQGIGDFDKTPDIEHIMDELTSEKIVNST